MTSTNVLFCLTNNPNSKDIQFIKQKKAENYHIREAKSQKLFGYFA